MQRLLWPSLALLFSALFVGEGFAEPLRIGSAQTPDLAAALAYAHGRTIVIDTPLTVSASLDVPEDVHLCFEDQGKLVRDPNSDSITVTIPGPLTATYRPIFENFRSGEVRIPARRVKEVVPQWWGSVGDGLADDTDAVQSALYASHSIYLPEGSYRITRPLDLTNRQGVKVVGQANCEGRGAALIADTGGVALNVTGSSSTHLADLYITNSVHAGIGVFQNPSTIGLMYMRSDKFSAAEPSSLARVRVDFLGNPSANGGHGTIGVYNIAAEGWRAVECGFSADVPVVFASSNIWGISSPHTGQGTIASMAGASFFHCYFHAQRGPVFRLSTPSDFLVYNGQVFGNENCMDPSRFVFDIDGNFADNVRFSGHIEQWPKIVRVGTKMTGCEFDGTAIAIGGENSTPTILVDGTGHDAAGLNRCRFNLHSYWDKQRDPHVYLRTKGNKLTGIENSTFHIDNHQSFEVHGRAFYGNHIHVNDGNQKSKRLPVVDVRLTDAQPSYVLYSPQGIEFVGPVKFRDK